MSMLIGPITRLMTGHLYASINSRSSWDSQVEINDEVKGELQLWYSHLPILNGFLISPKSSSVAFVYSDASQTGFWGLLGFVPSPRSCRTLGQQRKSTSSTMC